MGLRDLVATGSGSARSPRQFTDRTDQRQAFRASLDSCRTTLAEPHLVTDLSTPRRNVLHFYGLGGVGKSALSRRLQSDAEALLRDDLLVFRYDFASPAVHDLEGLVVGSRAILARAGVPAAAFDLMFGLYWARAHPGRSVPSFLFRGRGGEVIEEIDVGAVVEESIVALAEDMLNSATFGVAGAVHRLGVAAIGRLVQRSKHHALLRDCPYLELAMAEEDDLRLLAFLPHFLAWDLHRLQRKKAAAGEKIPVLLFFFDTWEDVQAGSGHLDSFEDRLAQFVFLMPNCLFVLTGRERLRWTDVERQGDWLRGGERTWPQLPPAADETSAQHLLGRLADKDSADFLRSSAPHLVLSDDVVDAAVSSSKGHPYILELTLDVLETRAAAGESLTADSLPDGFSKLFSRFLRDLEGVETDLALAAGSVPAFSDPMLSAMVPQASPSARRAFLQRHFVEGTGSSWLPYRVHETVRQAAAEAAPRWWPADHWLVSQTRAASALADQASNLSSDDPHVREFLAQSLIIGIRLLAAGAVLGEEWLDIIDRAATSGMDPELVRLEAALEAGSPAAQLAAIVQYYCGVEGEARLLGAGDIDLPAGAPIWVQNLLRAASARRAMLNDDPELAFELVSSIVDPPPFFHRRALKTRLLATYRSGDLVAADEQLGGAPGEILDAFESADLRGHISFWRGEFEAAAGYFAEGVELAGGSGASLNHARALRHLARVLAIVGSADATKIINEARLTNDAIGSTVGLAQLDLVDALMAAREGDADRAVTLSTSAVQTLRRLNARHDLGEAAVLQTLAHRACGDSRLLDGDSPVRGRLATSVVDYLNGRIAVLSEHRRWGRDAEVVRTRWSTL